MAVLGESITYKNPIWDLKWAAVWEGGIGREDCTAIPLTPPLSAVLGVTVNFFGHTVIHELL